MKTGLFFGTFNPVHHGHMMIANYMHEFTDLDEIWFIITPQSPFKTKSSMLEDRDRLHLVRLAIGDDYNMQASDVEFSLPKPNYTIHTLTHLREKHHSREFILIMGGDNLYDLHKWYNYEKILEDYRIYVYNRPGADIPERWKDALSQGVISLFDAPQMEISSSFIRNSIAEGKNISRFMPENVYIYIKEMHFYE
ncbi:MAG: nicotinate (nicotinamide) nucleotide adenylyltransferase [Bacteroidota bacterium]